MIKKMYVFLAMLLCSLAVCTRAWATDYYLIGAWNQWSPSSNYRFEVDNTNKVATVSLPAEVMNTANTGDGVWFSVSAVEPNGNNWRCNPSVGTNVTLSTPYDYSSYYSKNDDSFHLATVETTGTYKVTLNFQSGEDINKGKLTLTYEEATSGNNPSAGVGTSATDYYFISDWTDWSTTNKSFKLLPTETPNEYRMYISADYYSGVKNEIQSGQKVNKVVQAGNYSVNFKIISGADMDAHATDGQFGNYTLCANAVSNVDVNVDKTSATGTGGKGDYGAWKLVGLNKNSLDGDMLHYVFTINVQTGKWSIVPNTDCNVAYFMSQHNGWTSTEVLFEKSNYNDCGNFFGKVWLEPGMQFKCCDGYQWYGMNGSWPDLNLNKQDNVVVPQSVQAGYYYIEANPTRSIITSSDQDLKTVRLIPKYKVGSATEWTDMTQVSAGVYAAANLSVNNGEQVLVQETITRSGSTYTDNYELTNDPQGNGTYKLVYYQQDGVGTGVQKLMQTQLTSTIAGKTLRTYSDYVARVIPEGLKAYYATNYNTGTHALELTAITDGIISANTGVVLVYDGSTENIHFDKGGDIVNISMEKSELPGVQLGTNYLVAEQTSVSLGPVTKDETGNVVTRNYYLSYMAPTTGSEKILAFFRCLSQTGSNAIIRKAYLAMPAAVQPDASSDNLGFETSDATPTGAKMLGILLDGEPLFPWISTGVGNPDVPVVDNEAYYDLQGRKVKPTAKGIYIHAGKKIMLK